MVRDETVTPPRRGVTRKAEPLGHHALMGTQIGTPLQLILGGWVLADLLLSAMLHGRALVAQHDPLTDDAGEARAADFGVESCRDVLDAFADRVAWPISSV
jgi:hypothetical protein